MRPLTLFASMALCASAATRAQVVTPGVPVVIALGVPPFDSSHTKQDPELGKEAAHIINLQILYTLQVPKTPDGVKHGQVSWDDFSTAPTNDKEAEDYGNSFNVKPQMILWGRTWYYGNGTVAEAFLIIRDDAQYLNPPGELWTVMTPDKRRFSVGVRERHIEFSPLVITAKARTELGIPPSKLPLYSDQKGTRVVGVAGDCIRGLERGTDMEKIQTNSVEPATNQCNYDNKHLAGQIGWVRFPNLSKTHSEIVDFSAGLIRLFRHDWPGAFQSLKNVVNNPDAPVPVRLDAYLYMAIAADKMGFDSQPWAVKAYGLNPYSKTVVQYLCMSKLATYNRLGDHDRRSLGGSQILQELKGIIATTSPLFFADDAWRNSLKEFVSGQLSQTPHH